MTKEQAIEELTRAAELCSTTPLAEACRYAVDVLSATTEDKLPHDCINCRHKDRTPGVYPCSQCEQRYSGMPSKWEPKGGVNMGKLIDEQTAYDVLTDYYHHTTDTQRQALMDALSRVPTVDAVPVVRCEDCRFWSKYPGSSAAPQYHECMARMTHIGNLYTTAWEYCSRGERKDGERHEND